MNIEEVRSILKRNDLDMRLYFTMKSGSKYNTYSPSIEEALYEDLIKLIDEYMSKFLEHEQVGFSPVGYKEGTIETCDCGYIKSFDKVMNTLKEDLVKLLEKNGWYIKRNGGNHDIYTNGKDIEPIPRHKEINERLAKAIIKILGL